MVFFFYYSRFFFNSKGPASFAALKTHLTWQYPWFKEGKPPPYPLFSTSAVYVPLLSLLFLTSATQGGAMPSLPLVFDICDMRRGSLPPPCNPPPLSPFDIHSLGRGNPPPCFSFSTSMAQEGVISLSFLTPVMRGGALLSCFWHLQLKKGQPPFSLSCFWHPQLEEGQPLLSLVFNIHGPRRDDPPSLLSHFLHLWLHTIMSSQIKGRTHKCHAKQWPSLQVTSRKNWHFTSFCVSRVACSLGSLWLGAPTPESECFVIFLDAKYIIQSPELPCI